MSNPPLIDAPSEPPSEWNAPKPKTLVKPTWWPAAMAFGITATAWGLINSVIIVAMAVGVVAVALAGWIGDIRHERKKREE